MDNHFTIAHLSDLHLTVTDNESRTGKGRLRGMNRHFKTLLQDKKLLECDRIVITGDITDRGHLAAWKIFWDAITAAGVKDKTIVVPGNHDMCCLEMVRGIPEEESRLIAQQGLEMGDQKTTFPWGMTDENRRVAFFGLNSNNEGNPTAITNAIGRIGFTQLYKLGRLIHEEYSDVKTRIILLHHSPNIPQTDTSRRRNERPMPFYERIVMKLKEEDRRQLRLICRIFRARAILHGHTHDTLNRSVNGVRMISAPPSTEPDGEGKLHYLHHKINLDLNRLTYRTVKVKS